MIKKSLFLRIGFLMLLATLATSGWFMGSSTYAKYVARATYAASGRVALFAVYAGVTKGYTASDPAAITTSTGTKIHATDCAVVSITNSDGYLGTLYEADFSAQENAGAATPNGDTAVANHLQYNDGRHIAPGTGGRIAVQFYNYSEVAVRFYLGGGTDGIGASVSSVPDNSGIQFCATTTGTWQATIGAALSRATTYVDVGPKSGSTTPLYVYWRWPFGTAGDAITEQDQYDTNLGINTTDSDTYRLKISDLAIRCEQID